MARQSTEGTAEIGRTLLSLVHEQTRQNLDILWALTAAVDWNKAVKAVDWERVVQLQGELLRGSLDRSAQLTQRYLEVTQAVMAATAFGDPAAGQKGSLASFPRVTDTRRPAGRSCRPFASVLDWALDSVAMAGLRGPCPTRPTNRQAGRPRLSWRQHISTKTTTTTPGTAAAGGWRIRLTLRSAGPWGPVLGRLSALML